MTTPNDPSSDDGTDDAAAGNDAARELAGSVHQAASGHLGGRLRAMLADDLGELLLVLRGLVRWTLLGAVVGVLAGASSAVFLVTLDWATRTRLEHGWLIAFLPLAGLAVGAAYHYGGGRSDEGNNLILDEIHEPREWIPRRMAPLVYAGTVITQLFGGSAGREGTAIQMAGSLTDAFSRVIHLGQTDRRRLLVAALAGGFGSVFGVPVAGLVFGLEVQSIGRLRYDALVPAAAASIVGDLVVRAFGVHHGTVPLLSDLDITPILVAKVALAGIAFGLTGQVFTRLTHAIRRVFAARVAWPPLRPFLGGLLVVALTLLVGDQTYNGLSLGLIAGSLAGGVGVATFAFAIKLLFTSVTLGTGFQGGEVTPLFVIGATLGVTLGHLLGVPPQLMAAIGFVAVFAGAANVPLACTVMAAELFGADGFVLFAVACVVSYAVSPHEGIYHSQRVAIAKHGRSIG